jgi:hypothetical protein
VLQAPVKLYALLSQPETDAEMAHIGYYLLKNEGTRALSLSLSPLQKPQVHDGAKVLTPLRVQTEEQS